MEVNTRMPNAKVLSEKQAIVAELTEKIQKASAGVLVDYKGITVEEDTALRRECRENGVDYAVVKNTLLRFAFNNTGLNELDDLLNGTTSLALCEEDVVAPARVMSDYAKKLNDKFETMALKSVLKEHAGKVSVSSTKGATGHGLGAAGGLESIVCVKTIETGIIAPTINYETPDPACDLDVTPNKAKERNVKVAVNQNLGFGGHNGVLIFRKFE